MYIAPNTDIYILHNIPLGKDYENTVYYKDAASQEAAFIKYMKYHLTEYSYQRQQLGTLRIELKYAQLYDCNYLMFKNSSFENKWFYCFITGIGYVNDNVTEIYYEMDVMQTWCYDYQFLDTFVERRHASHDALWANTQPEGLELGSYYRNSQRGADRINISLPIWYCALATEIPSAALPSGITGQLGGPGNILSGVWFLYTNDKAVMQNTIRLYNSEGKGNAIIALYLAPNGNTDNIQTPLKTTYSFTPQLQYIDNLVVHNYKLFTSPYRKIVISNRNGSTLELKQEAFKGTRKTLSFTAENSGFPLGLSRIYPYLYSQGGNYTDVSITYGNFPTCAFATDAFKEWWAQNKSNYIATLNSIQRNYDTNLAIGQNNLAIANRSARAQGAIAKNSADTSLANATMMNNSALDQSINTFNAQLGSLGANAAVGVGLDLLDLNIGSAIGTATSGITSAQTLKASLQNATAQNTVSNAAAANTAGTAIKNSGIAMSAAMKNAATSVESAQLSALTAKQNSTEMLMAKKEDIANIPDTARGNAMCDSLNALAYNIGYTISVDTITLEYASNIDSYFTAYGYAQRRLYRGSLLNTRINRPHFTFLKTVGANIKGKMNAADLGTIKAIYDNGITTWDNLEDVGNYSLNNEADHKEGVE